jgi:hypothetical protein
MIDIKIALRYAFTAYFALIRNAFPISGKPFNSALFDKVGIPTGPRE